MFSERKEICKMSMMIVKLEPLSPFDGNIWKLEFISKQQRQKLEWTIHNFGHATWTISDFANNLNFTAIGLDPHKVITSKVIFHEDLVLVFGEKQQNGSKVKVNDYLFEDEFASLHKLYENIYAHPPSNNDYLGIFLKGWLVDRSGKVVNWVCYAYDIIEEQMKRAKRSMPPLVPSSKGNKISRSSKHNSAVSLQGNPSFVEDDECFVVDKPKHLRVYLPKQLVVLKELLECGVGPKEGIWKGVEEINFLGTNGMWFVEWSGCCGASITNFPINLQFQVVEKLKKTKKNWNLQ